MMTTFSPYSSGIVVPVGPYTASFTSALMNVGNNGGGLMAFLNVNTVASGTVTMTIQGYDPASGNLFNMLSTTAIGSPGFSQLIIHPSVTTATNAALNSPLPPNFQLVITASGAGIINYSVGLVSCL